MFKTKLKRMWHDDRPFGMRLAIVLGVNIFLAFSLVFFTPCETFLSNPGDFSFGFSALALTMGGAALVYIVIASAVMLLLRGLVFDAVTSALFAFGIGAYVQGNFMNTSVSILNGDAIDWSLLTGDAAIGLAVWGIIFVIPFAVRYFSKEVWNKVMIFVSAFFVVIQATALVSLLITADKGVMLGDRYLSGDGIYNVGDENNVIVLLVDYFDNKYADSMIAEDADVFSELTGFTRFTNCSSMYKQTMPSIPYILTAEKWYRETPYSTFSVPAFEKSTFLDRVAESGASIDLYTNGGFLGRKGIGYASNSVLEHPEINRVGLVKSMLNSVLYRVMPLAMKSLFWYYTDTINNAVLTPTDDSAENPAFVIDDAATYKGLCENGVSYYEDGRDTTFKFIHFMGGHGPYVLDENAQYSDNTTAMKQYRGCFKVVSEYLAGLKKIGAYDKSTIIIMADHGVVYVADELSEAPSPVLFVKPAGADSNAPMTESAAPVSQSEFHATVLEALGMDGSDYGCTFFDIDENAQRTRNFYFRVAYDGSDEESLLEYEINGNVRDIANWKLTGNKW